MKYLYYCLLAAVALNFSGSIGWSKTKHHAAATERHNATVEPDALNALKRMSAYLGTLDSFELKADTTVDQVFKNGQKLQFGGQVTYKVRRPNGFVIELATDRKLRRFYYDGKSLTQFAPVAGLFAVVPAPPTIREVMQMLSDRYNIVIPMTDLFRWSDPNDKRAEPLISAVYVGYAKINGADTDHYAFREANVDWQVWIEQGDKPLPLKIVITSTALRGEPQFTSEFAWTENSSYGDDTFVFHPAAGNLQIHLSAIDE